MEVSFNISEYSWALFRPSRHAKWTTSETCDTITVCAPHARRVLRVPRFPFGDNNRDRWGTRSSHVTPRSEDGASTVHARPLSRERSKSKPTSQPIVNTGTTGEFNSIRTRSSDCSIVRHRIPPTRSCGLFPLYLSLPPFPSATLACNPQRSPLTLSWPPLRSVARTHTSVDRNAHRIFPSSSPPCCLCLSICLILSYETCKSRNIYAVHGKYRLKIASGILEELSRARLNEFLGRHSEFNHLCFIVNLLRHIYDVKFREVVYLSRVN